MRKRFFVLILQMTLVLGLFPGIACAEDAVVASMEEVYSWLDFSAVEEIRIALPKQETELSVAELVRVIAEGETVAPEELLEIVFSEFISGLMRKRTMMLTIMIPVLLVTLFSRTLCAENSVMKDATHFSGFLFVLIPLVTLIIEALSHTKDTIVSMTTQMDKMLPLLLTLLTALGGSASSAFLHPVVITASGSMVFLAREIVLRLVMCTTMVTAVNHLCGGEHLGRMAQLLRGAVCWLLGVSFTVFLGAMTMQGVCSASIDGVAIRAAKYAVDNFVPIIGGMFSDTMDTLIGCTLIVKNALGVASVFVLLSALTLPLIGTIVSIFILKLTAALLEPVADADIVGAISDFSRILVLFFVTMLCVATMYFLLIVQVLLVGNLTVMIR